MKERVSNLFKSFFVSEKSSGILLILVTVISILITNSSLQESYLSFWEKSLAGMKIENWVNDALMAFFFLLIGLELKREFQVGELSSFKKAILPGISALGGVVVPALIYTLFNFTSTTKTGFGIPMATDIAFALGALSLLGNRIPFSIKIFLTALAVIDDLAAIVVIALFYSKGIVLTNLLISLALFGVLLTFNKFKIKNLWVYMSVAVAMWYFMHHSGIHATITGVLLAFAIPVNHSEHKSPSAKLERILQKPVPYLILPIFAMANTAIIIESNWSEFLLANYSKGIFLGLVIGKPIGITLFTFIAVKLGICKLPKNISWTELFGIAILGGIGFTMSIFVTLLAFEDAQIINNSKFVILLSSLCAGIIGYIWLRIVLIGHKSLDS